MSYSGNADGLGFTLPAGNTLYATFTAYDMTDALAKSEADRLNALGLRVVVYKRSLTVNKLIGPLGQFQDKPWTYVVCVFNPSAAPISGNIKAEGLSVAETAGIEKVLDDSAMKGSSFAGGAMGAGLLAGLAAVLVLKSFKKGRP